MLMPSHAKNVKPYKEPEPVFIRFQVERQLAAMFSPQVVLRSGGYIVINQTEALVSIDVNSGKATREHNIEDTALKTNLEASDEIARQLRLRDLAGLIVIDFIDMDERRNNRLVERRLKEALRNDRARIQVGRISHFGLLEMSRQRLRTGMLEGSTKPCPVCQGTGMVRSIESVALDILRSIEDRLITDGVVPLVATTAVDVALYILNQKRAHLNDIQLRYRIPITVTADENMHVSQFVIERAAEGEIANGGGTVVHMDWAHHDEAPAVAPPAHTAPPQPAEAEGEQKGRALAAQAAQRPASRRRRRRTTAAARSRPGSCSHPRRRARGRRGARRAGGKRSGKRWRGVQDRRSEGRKRRAEPQRSAPERPARRPARPVGPEAAASRWRGAQGDAPAERGLHKEARPAGEGDVRQNGAGRQKRADEAPPQEVQQPHHEAERVLASVSKASEKPPASSEPRVEGPAEAELATPPRMVAALDCRFGRAIAVA